MLPAATGSPTQALPDALLRTAAPAHSALPLPKLLLVLAHPDDEVLALGARLERLSASRLITVTDGAPSDGADARHHGFATLEAYRAARRAELLCALAHAGLRSEVAPDLAVSFPDQQASLHLAALTRAVAAQILDFRPACLLTHPFEGGHPDHDACAFAVHTAVQLLGKADSLPILETPFYHRGGSGHMCTGAFLPGAGPCPTLVLDLTPEEQSLKAARLACFKSQAATLAQFCLEQESFRVAPRYDFTRRPHDGTLFYEQFPWGMRADRFAQLAVSALAELSVKPPFGAPANAEKSLSTV